MLCIGLLMIYIRFHFNSGDAIFNRILGEIDNFIT